MPDHIYIEPAAKPYPLAQAILAACPDCPVEEASDHRRIRVEAETPDAAFRLAKRRLALAVKWGEFVKPFPQGECDAGRDFAISHGANCPFDCDYCFLQGYFEHAVPTVFVNVDDLCAELAAHAARHESLRPRYHAGDLCDALAFDRLTGLAQRLGPVFERHRGATLELRTKAAVGPPAGLAALPNVVASWTLTPAAVAEAIERGAATPQARIRAARAWQDAGFCVGVRFDPMVRWPGWEGAYGELIDQLEAALRLDRIESVVIGGMRFLPELARVAAARGRGGIFVDEFVLCADGKLRYFRPIREAMYGLVAERVRAWGAGVRVALCMETECVRRRLVKKVCGMGLTEHGGGPRIY